MCWLFVWSCPAVGGYGCMDVIVRVGVVLCICSVYIIYFVILLHRYETNTLYR